MFRIALATSTALSFVLATLMGCALSDSGEISRVSLEAELAQLLADRPLLRLPSDEELAGLDAGEDALRELPRGEFSTRLANLLARMSPPAGGEISGNLPLLRRGRGGSGASQGRVFGAAMVFCPPGTASPVPSVRMRVTGAPEASKLVFWHPIGPNQYYEFRAWPEVVLDTSRCSAEAAWGSTSSLAMARTVAGSFTVQASHDMPPVTDARFSDGFWGANDVIVPGEVFAGTVPRGDEGSHYVITHVIAYGKVIDVTLRIEGEAGLGKVEMVSPLLGLSVSSESGKNEATKERVIAENRNVTVALTATYPEMIENFVCPGEKIRGTCTFNLTTIADSGVEKLEIVASIVPLETRSLSVAIQGENGGHGSVALQAFREPLPEGQPAFNCGDLCEQSFPYIQGRLYTGFRLAPEPSPDSVFLRWEGGCTGENCNGVLNGNKNITAVFGVPLATLKVAASPAEGGSVRVSADDSIEGDCAGENGCSVRAGTTVTLTAEPVEGYQFDGWRDPGDVEEVPSGNSWSFPLEYDRAETAVFSKKSYQLTMSINSDRPNESGAVIQASVGPRLFASCDRAQCVPSQRLEHGVLLEFTVLLDQDFELVNSSIEAPKRVTGDVSVSITIRKKHGLIVDIEREGGGLIAYGRVTGPGIDCGAWREGSVGNECEARFADNAQVALVASPWLRTDLFKEWKGVACDEGPTSPRCTFRMTSSVSATAVFRSGNCSQRAVASSAGTDAEGCESDEEVIVHDETTEVKETYLSFENDVVFGD